MLVAITESGSAGGIQPLALTDDLDNLPTHEPLDPLLEPFITGLSMVIDAYGSDDDVGGGESVEKASDGDSAVEKGSETSASTKRTDSGYESSMSSSNKRASEESTEMENPAKKIRKKNSQVLVEIPLTTRYKLKKREPTARRSLSVLSSSAPPSTTEDALFIHKLLSKPETRSLLTVTDDPHYGDYDELILEDFFITDERRLGLAPIRDKPRNGEQDEKYIVEGTLRTRCGARRERCWFRYKTYQLDTHDMRTPEPRFWMLSHKMHGDRDENAAVSYLPTTPAPQYAHIWSLTLRKMKVAKLVINWACAAEDPQPDDLIGYGPGSFLTWLVDKFGEAHATAFLKDLDVSPENFLNVVKRHAAHIYCMAAPHLDEKRHPFFDNSMFNEIVKEPDLSNTKKGKKKGADRDEMDKFMKINLTPIVDQVAGAELRNAGMRVSILELARPLPPLVYHDIRSTVTVPQPYHYDGDDEDDIRTLFPPHPVRRDRMIEYYDHVMVNGKTYRAGDDILVWPGGTEGKKAFEQSQKAGAWVARVRGFYENLSAKAEVKEGIEILWYYFGVDGVLSSVYTKTDENGDHPGILNQPPDYRELFLSNHPDDVPMGSLICHAHVHDTLFDLRVAVATSRAEDEFKHFWCESFEDNETGTILHYVPSKQPIFACEVGVEREDVWYSLEGCADGKVVAEVDVPEGGEETKDYSRVRVLDAVYRVGDVVYLTPKRGNRYEVFVLERIEKRGFERACEARIHWRRFWKRDKVVSDGSINEYLIGREEEVVVVEKFVERVAGKVSSMEFVRDGGELPVHLREFIAGAGKVFWFSKGWDEEKKEVVKLPEENEMERRFPPWNPPKQAMDLPSAQKSPFKPLRMFEVYAGVGGSGLGLDLSGATISRYAIDANRRVLQANRLNCPDPSYLNILHAESGSALRASILYWKKQSTSKGKLSASPASKKSWPTPGEIDLLIAGPPCQGFARENRFTETDDAVINRSQYWVTLSWIEYLQPKYCFIENVFNITRHKDSAGIPIVIKIIFTLRRLGYQVRPVTLSALQHGLAQNRVRLIVVGVKKGYDMLDDVTVTHMYNDKIRTVGDTGSGERLMGVDKVDYSFMRSRCLRDVVGGLKRIGDNGNVPDYNDPDHVTLRASRLSLLHMIKQISPGQCIHSVPAHIFPLIGRARPPPGKRLKQIFRRYRWEDHTQTVTTGAGMVGYFGIHPEDNRGFTISEARLLQGFPDRHVVFGTVEEKFAAYGNAVPPPMGFALGCALRRGIMEGELRREELKDGGALNVLGGRGSEGDAVEEWEGSVDGEGSVEGEDDREVWEEVLGDDEGGVMGIAEDVDEGAVGNEDVVMVSDGEEDGVGDYDTEMIWIED